MALLPMGGTALLGAGVAIFLSRTDVGSQPAWMPTAVLGTAILFLAMIAYLAWHTASTIEADLGRRIAEVRRSTLETHYKIWQVLDDLQRKLPPEQRWSVPLPNQAHRPASTDEAIQVLAVEAQLLRQVADAIAARGVPAPAPEPGVTVQHPAPIETASVHSHVGIFVNLARRLQSLVHREIEQLDELENQVEDPDLLKGLFSVDHLATRIRRHAENLAVLGGAPSHRQWSRPVSLYEALRSAVAEVEQYARVRLVRPIDGTLKGHVVADVIHLVAELVENATAFSSPQTQVLLRAQRVRAGVAVEVEDRGLGMEQEERDRYNAMLKTPDEVDLDELLADGRIGLYVVSSLARRHDTVVELQSNIFGGTQAVIVLRESLLGDDTPAAPAPQLTAHPSAPTHTPALPSLQLAASGADTGRHSRSQPVAGPGYSPAPIYSPPPVSETRYETAEIPALDAEGRPELPKRNRQSHLAPQLRDVPPSGTRGSEAGHDPGLMKAFQQGLTRADASDDAPQIPSSDSSVTPYRHEEA